MAPFYIPAVWHGYAQDSKDLINWFAFWFVLFLNIFFLGFQVFPDGIFPAGGKSEIEGIFPPPYFEWFQTSSSIKYDLQIASDETTEISSYNGILIPDFIFQLQFGHHHNLVCLSYSCQRRPLFHFPFLWAKTVQRLIFFFCTGVHGIHKSRWMHFISVWLHGEKWTFWRPTWILPGKNEIQWSNYFGAPENCVLCFCGVWVYLAPEIR